MSSNLERCLICYKSFSISEIEQHTNMCIFLNTTNAHNKNYAPDTSLKIPLTEQLKPKTFEEFYGQECLVDTSTSFRLSLENNHIPSVILWGPPGCGKTSLCNIIETICVRNDFVYSSMSGINCNIRYFHSEIAHSKEVERRRILFIDQIHWLDKHQQKLILYLVNNHNLTLVGTTTENPSFCLSETFLSVCHLVKMEKLQLHSVEAILKHAAFVLDIDIVDDKNTLTNMLRNKNKCSITKSTIKRLSENCDGDARIALNNLEVILSQNSSKMHITDEIKKCHLLYDRDGEDHHNIISAMHESIKGYSANASMYWTSRMLSGGEDPKFIARRLVRASSEDTGNSDPNAILVAVSAMKACQSLDTSECDVILAQCAIYLARSWTSKQAHTALTLAKQMIHKSKGNLPEVPLHLCNLPNKLIKEFDHNNVSNYFLPLALKNVNFL
ncbi:hypothetical protein FQA39_LY15746 [Lamprigera yunnana]|nr:hypothetical protein FQA39_LY15746 [Lamprigera yunnana]